MFKKRSKLSVIYLTLLGFLVVACQPNTKTEQAPALTTEQEIPESHLDQNYAPERWIWQKPELVMDMLGDMEDKTIADIGAGLGYFSLALAQRAKKVIAIDINKRQLDFIEQEKNRVLPERFKDRIETRLVTHDDPRIGPQEADLILVVNTYIYLPDRVNYIRKLRENLPDGGKVLIINFKKKNIQAPPGVMMPEAEDRVSLYQVEEEVTAAGYTTVISDDTSLDYQYIVLVEK